LLYRYLGHLRALRHKRLAVAKEKHYKEEKKNISRRNWKRTNDFGEKYEIQQYDIWGGGDPRNNNYCNERTMLYKDKEKSVENLRLNIYGLESDIWGEFFEWSRIDERDCISFMAGVRFWLRAVTDGNALANCAIEACWLANDTH
jgi:hypothetical protein